MHSARKLYLISYEAAGSVVKGVRLRMRGDDTGNSGLNSRLSIRQTIFILHLLLDPCFFLLEEVLLFLR